MLNQVNPTLTFQHNAWVCVAVSVSNSVCHHLLTLYIYSQRGCQFSQLFRYNIFRIRDVKMETQILQKMIIPMYLINNMKEDLYWFLNFCTISYVVQTKLLDLLRNGPMQLFQTIHKKIVHKPCTNRSHRFYLSKNKLTNLFRFLFSLRSSN